VSEHQPIDLDDFKRVSVKVREMTDDNWLADMVEIAAAEIARLREERRWISVGERLPDEDLQVLVWGKGWRSPAIGWREHRPWYIVPETIWTLGDELDKGYPPEKITHWLPMPPGPEGDA
jgi:hypothetical protein